MAFQTPIFVQNENLPIHRGKGADGAKIDLPKPAKVVNQDRKALRDLSRVGKPPFSAASKCPTVKEKSSFTSLKSNKSGLKNTFVANNEETMRCNEWAMEGIEHVHYTGNDVLKTQKEKKEERIVKKVEKVLTTLHKWNDMAFGIGVPLEKNPTDSEDVTMIDLMPEVLPPMRTCVPISGIKEADDFLCDPAVVEFLLMDYATELKLKDDNNDHGDDDGDDYYFCIVV